MLRDDVATYDWPEADAGDGRVLRGGAFYLLMMEPRGLTHAASACNEAAGAGREVGSFDGAGCVATCGWLEG